MFRVDNASSVVSLPSPSAPGTQGYFTPGNPGTGAPPTILQAEWCNRIQEELMSIVLAQAAITPSKTVYSQVAQSLLSGALTFALDTSGAANTITVALPVTPVALTDGMKITVKIANTNTGATNLNLNAFGNKPCYYKGAVFIGGEVTAGQYYDFVYSTGGNLWTLDSPSGGQAGLYIGTAATGGTANAQTVSVTPGGYVRRTGNLINVLAGATNSAALTLNISAVGAVSVKKRSGGGLVDLASGDWVNTQEYLLQDDGVYYELVDQPIPSFGALATLGVGDNLSSDGTNLSAAANTGHISGFLPSAIAGSSTTASLSVSTGFAAPAVGTANIVKGSVTGWNVSNGNGINGYEGGTTLPNSSTIHFFICSGASGTGVFASTSLTPTFPTGFAVNTRRIFSLRTDGAGAPIPYIACEVSGGGYLAEFVTLPAQTAALTTSASTVTLSNIPTGIRVSVFFRTAAGTNPSYAIWSSLSATDVAPNVNGTAPGASVDQAGTQSITGIEIITNTSAQIRGRASTASNFYIYMDWWEDFRRS